MLNRTPVVIRSVSPLQGHEGTIVTLQGSGFARHIRNNCVVIGGMGACARAEPHSTDTELKVRIGPVARETAGDLLMWPGVGGELFTEEISYGNTRLHLSEAAVFRNGAPVAAAGIHFKLDKASPDTYSGAFEKSARGQVQLGGQETAPVMRVAFPKGFSAGRHKKVDVCVVLKEPTLAVDISASIAGKSGDDEECLRAVAKAISLNAGLMGERVFADVGTNAQTGELELYITKPYLENGMVTIHFS
ncbi:IPT/TIG domain-containing protein [Janthinobacterium fluminis]|uniref:IPT/TIG domain-containing protein n=1 Tax=Janthinobacterium fluminis TaxID=2987524 RepID=A0ABT5JZV3_9BURK|nr:IPT/TIG domain-containing protein [Janthinobacterium fluminis]MDC8758244.1 IPT/TIG domain-containing protein [Janthinobacterium fluminis]